MKDGVQLGLPAKALHRNEDGQGSWMDVKVLAYDKTTKKVIHSFPSLMSIFIE